MKIDKFLEAYREFFPHATITPKLHTLEDHVIPFLTKWGIGLGFLGEHGAESIHARFNELRRKNAKITEPTKRLYSMMFDHYLQVCPDNIQKMPEKTKRVFKKARRST